MVSAAFTAGKKAKAHRIVLYGPAGIGKTTLAAWLEAPAFLDCEKGTKYLDVNADSVGSWAELRGKLAWLFKNPPAGIKTLVIDTITAAEEFAKEHVIANRTTDKGKPVESIEGFGWGKGWKFIYEEFNGLLADIDRIVEAHGISVCLIAHEVTSPVPHPGGEDYLRWEPNLYGGDKKGNASTRNRLKGWADFVLFLGYDLDVQGGKASGAGTRTIYPFELPTHIAKTRVPCDIQTFDLSDPGRIWRELGIHTPTT